MRAKRDPSRGERYDRSAIDIRVVVVGEDQSRRANHTVP